MASKPNMPKHAGVDPEAASNYVARIETLAADRRAVQESIKDELKQIGEDIKSIYDEAKDRHGISPKALKAAIKARELERKAEDARTKLDAGEQDTFDNIRHALGDLADLPLDDTPRQADA